jgi:hypothetical protein
MKLSIHLHLLQNFGIHGVLPLLPICLLTWCVNRGTDSPLHHFWKRSVAFKEKNMEQTRIKPPRYSWFVNSIKTAFAFHCNNETTRALKAKYMWILIYRRNCLGCENALVLN